MILKEAETIEEINKIMIVHRLSVHKTANTEEFFDCALCGAIESKLNRAHYSKT